MDYIIAIINSDAFETRTPAIRKKRKKERGMKGGGERRKVEKIKYEDPVTSDFPGFLLLPSFP